MRERGLKYMILQEIQWPREWFHVKLESVAEIVELLQNNTLNNFKGNAIINLVGYIGGIFATILMMFMLKLL